MRMRSVISKEVMHQLSRSKKPNRGELREGPHRHICLVTSLAQTKGPYKQFD
jgi:hypothetical protein